MSLFVTSLNSGSNGNCYYVGNQDEAVLIDAGISCRETEKRMKRLGLSMAKVKAIFISHEHSDHIRGLHSIIKKFHLPVYITPPTLSGGGLYLDPGYVRNFSADLPVTVGRLHIRAFSKFHDASDPYSFVVRCEGITVGVFTDIGRPCHRLIENFKQCHAAFLESNYDEDMLEAGNYPRFLKNRISGGHGHLSNSQALEIFTRHRPSFMTHLILAHLSQNNNSPELVQQLFDRHAGDVKMIVAPRYQETPLFHISDSSKSIFRHELAQGPAQLELF